MYSAQLDYICYNTHPCSQFTRLSEMDRNNFSQANSMNQARTKNSYSLKITKKVKIGEQIFIDTNDVRWLRNKLRQAPVSS